MTDPSTFGGRLRAARFARNLTLYQLSDFTATDDQPGYSVAYLSRLEHGTRRLDKYSTAVRIALALGVDPVQLTGHPIEYADPTHHEAWETIAPIRLALVANYLGHPGVETRLVEQITPDVDAVVALRTQADLSGMGRRLPALIAELYSASATTRGDERRAALRQLVRVLNSAMTIAHALGYPDLAYMITMRSVEAAAELAETAWIGIARFSSCHAMLPMGGGEQAYRLSVRAADAARSAANDGAALAAYGSLLLVSARMAAGAGHAEEATQRLEEAEGVAIRTGETGPDTAFFGPTNLALYRMSTALEQDDPELAELAARSVDPAAIASHERRARFGVDLGRALARIRGREEEAVGALVAAEREAPLLVRGNAVARDLLPGLVGAVHPRSAAGRDARQLAWRMGLGAVVA